MLVRISVISRLVWAKTTTPETATSTAQVTIAGVLTGSIGRVPAACPPWRKATSPTATIAATITPA